MTGRVSPSDPADNSQSRVPGQQQREIMELNLFGNGSTMDTNANALPEILAELPSMDWTRSVHGKSLRQRSGSIKGASNTALRVASNEVNQELDLVSSALMRNLSDLMDVEDGSHDIFEEQKQNNIIKSLPAPMAHKRSVRRLNDERRKSNARLRLSCWKAFKLRMAMSWVHFRSGVRDWFFTLELWKGHMKEVEGNFGNGVLSYFVFLKSLLLLNVMIFMVEFCFTVVPQIAIEYKHMSPKTPITNYGVCPSPFANSTKIARSGSDQLLDFFTGQGWINTTIMFYSNYLNAKVVNSRLFEYNMPFAYILVGGSYFIVSLFLMVKNLAHGFTESIIESGGLFYSYCNKVFASWDYCIVSEDAGRLKCKNIHKDFEAELAEEARLERIKSRTRCDRFKIYLVRLLVTIVVMGMLAGSIYAIIKAVELSTDPSLSRQGNSFVTIMKRWASSLTISALNVALPPLFQLLATLEDWSPRVEVAIALWRAVLLKLSSVGVLVITLFTAYSAKDLGCTDCWENQIGAQMFNLIFVDFFVNVGLTIIVETGRKYVYRYVNCGCGLGLKIGMQEFQIPKNVLDLVYGQSLIWIGTFFAPLIPSIAILKLVVLFYVKKVSLMYNCKPSNEPYRGARSNYFFTLLLLLTFLLCSVAVGWGLTRIKTSCCGPFSNLACDSDHFMIDIIGRTVDEWPRWIGNVINFLKTAVFIFPLFIIIFLILYYYHAMTKAHERMIYMLKDQLVMEGRDKRFLMDRLILVSEQKRLSGNGRLRDIKTQETTMAEVQSD